ncbi:MAG: hypothetical protein ABJ242_03415 [Marinomonas sp.]|uniref:hypothetical protein n=1 Tax=Parasphingorhabdus sp. TaxID=2709688 RepID=UPI00328C1EF3
MRKRFTPGTLLPLALLIFFAFPYTQVVAIEAYTQPYAIVLSAIVLALHPQGFRQLPRTDKAVLTYLLGLGVVLVLWEIPQGLDLREIAYFLSYATPLLTTAAAFWAIQRHGLLANRVIGFAILAWFAVSLVQRFVDPSFLTQFVTTNEELGENIVASGRGVIGLAPEPTHNAFHVLMLGACLAYLRGPLWLIGLSFFTAIVLAGSASALLAIALGAMVWGLKRPAKRFWIFVPAAAGPIIAQIVAGFFSADSRVGSLLLRIQNFDLSEVMLDYSVNARLSGAIMPIYYSFERFLLPHGISLRAWYAARLDILTEHLWVVDLSGAGPASGHGLFIFQAGIFALPLLIYLIQRLIFKSGGGLFEMYGILVFMIFLGQLYFATPMFGLFLALVIFRSQQSRKRTKIALR